MTSRILAIAFVLLAWASPLLAQPRVDGKWTGVVASPQGDQTVTLTLQPPQGDSVKGTITDFQGGEQPIEDGLIQGDTVSFYQTLNFNGTMIELFYSALVRAEELLFTLDAEGLPQALRFIMKRAP